MPGSVCGPQDRAACGEPPQLGGGPAELCPKAPLPSVGSPCLLPWGSGLFCLFGEADAKS